MVLKDLKKIHSGKYVHLYNATYINENNQLKVYEFLSRNANLSKESFGNPNNVQAIGLILFNEDKTKILLQREYRLACNDWVWNFTGGLIDDNESVEEAAKRELKEETGLEIVSIDKILYPSYSSVGLTNEQVSTIIGTAKGTFGKSSSFDEEIQPHWFTKEEIKKLLENPKEKISMRTQSVLYMWSMS